MTKRYPKYYRGSISRLLPIQYLADMAGLTRAITKTLLYKWLKENDLEKENLSGAQVKAFVDYAIENKTSIRSRDIDDYLGI
jgi:hypothetical protein